MKKGMLYKSMTSYTVIKCTSEKNPHPGLHFTGVVISSDIYEIGHISNCWNCRNFELVKNTQEPELNVIL